MFLHHYYLGEGYSQSSTETACFPLKIVILNVTRIDGVHKIKIQATQSQLIEIICFNWTIACMRYECELATLWTFISFHLSAIAQFNMEYEASKLIAHKTFKSKQALNETALRSKEHARQHGVSDGVCVSVFRDKLVAARYWHVKRKCNFSH